MKTVTQILVIAVVIAQVSSAQTQSWQHLNGPHGGAAITFASDSNGDIFAGADYNQKGVYRSRDGGLTWNRASNGVSLTDRSIDWLVVDDSNHIIAGTGSHIGSRVYKSTDGGDNWVHIADLGGNSCAVNDSGHIYVGNTGYGQYSVSRDRGHTWTDYAHPSPFIFCIIITDSGHIFVGGNYTGYRSTDNGETWTSLAPMGLPDGIHALAVNDSGHLFAGCSREYAANSGIYRSIDNGDSWIPVKEGFRIDAPNNFIITGSGSIIVGTAGWGIWKSIDNGDTWTESSDGLGHRNIRSLHVTQSGSIVAGATGGGIYLSTDEGDSWTQVGLPVANVGAIAVDPANGNLLAAVSGVSRSTDAGQTWQPANSGLGNLDVHSFAVKSDGTILVGGSGGGYNPPPPIFRSLDHGNTWARADNGMPNHTVDAMAVDAEGNIYAGNYYGIYKSTDNGGSWVQIGTAGSARGLAFNSTGDLFAATWGNGIWRKLSGDTAWTNITASVYPYVDCIFIGSNDYIYAGKSRSTDNGETWTDMSNSGNNVSGYAENSAGHLFCGTYNYGSGVWRSTDYGETWEPYNYDLPVMDIRSVAVDPQDYLYAGSWGESMFKTGSSTLTSISGYDPLPVSFDLKQNAPNPFNPTTAIEYTVPRRSHVTLEIFNVLGQKVRTLVCETKSAGEYRVEWQGTDNADRPVATGIYLYRLQAGEQTQTRKMTLLK